MKTLLKIKSVLLAAALLFTLAPSLAALADAPNPNPCSITINSSVGHSFEGQTYEAYKLFDIATASNGETKYIINNDFIGFTGYDANNRPLLEYLQSISGSNKSEAEKSQEVRALADKLRVYIDANHIAATKTATGAAGSSYVTMGGLSEGYYFVYGISKDGQNNSTASFTASCLLTDENPAASITLKTEAPTLEKEVKDAEGEWSDHADKQIGDKIDYKLTSKVPNTNGYNKYEYTVHDKMSAGLTFDPDSVEVKIDGETIDAGPDTYTVVTPQGGASRLPDGCTFEIKFDDKYLLNSKPGTTIEITYSAYLNADAATGVAGNANEAKLDYSNDPSDGESHGTTPEQKVPVYTGELNIEKYTEEETENGGKVDKFLPGAEFELYALPLTTDPASKPIQFIRVSAGSAGSAAVYRVATQSEILANGDNLTTKLVTPDSGKIKLTGLAEGDYSLKETKAPSKYNGLEYQITVSLKFHYVKNPEGGSYWTRKTMEDTNDVNVSVPIRVLNVAGDKFPETGGIGRTIFYTVGLCIMAGAGIFLFMLRKKENCGAAR